MIDDTDFLLRSFQALGTRRASTHGLDDERGEWAALVEVAVRLVADGTAAEELPVLQQLARVLDDTDVLEAATGVGSVLGLRGDDGMAQHAYELFAAVARAHGTAGAHVAVARSQEALGDVAGMERSLRRALRADPDHVVAHRDLGELAALRGEFRTASRHFDRAGRPPLGLAAIAANLGTGPVRAARNEPCPCGSGARFKRCCLHTDGWSLDLRVALLPARIGDWVDRPVWLRRRLEFVARLVDPDADGGDADRSVDAALTPGVVGLYLFEGGGLRLLADEVGPLLRADEREVLARWDGCRHRLYQVHETSLGRARFVDAATGEVLEVGGLDTGLLEGGGGMLFAVLVPGAPAGYPPWVLGGEPIPVDRELTDEVRGMSDWQRTARTVLEPAIDFHRAVRTVERPRDPQRDERLRWLFGDRVDVTWVHDLHDVDDLVTTLHMTGGGFSIAADFIRAAARQIAEAEPPEVWTTAQQLTAAGHDQQTVLVHLAYAWATATQHGPDPAAVRAAHLEHLRTAPALAAAHDRRRRRKAS